ncbi:MAG: SH3 domain-containing protein [Chthoniobacterales bacterium]
MKFLLHHKTLLLAAGAATLFVIGAQPAAAAESAPALYNAGNAAQRAGCFGPAILDYERAHLLAPNDPSIARNLQLAREKAGVAKPEIPAWQRPAHVLSLNGLAALTSVSLVLCCLIYFCAPFFAANRTRLARGLEIAFGAVVVLAVVALAMRWPESQRAVIIVGGQPTARIAPAAEAASVFEVKPGEIVQTESVYGNFVRVRNTAGQSGWISRAEVKKIIPPAA